MKEFVDKFVDEVNTIDNFFVMKYKQYLDEFTHLQTQYLSTFENMDNESNAGIQVNSNQSSFIVPPQEQLNSVKPSKADSSLD